MIKTTSSKEVVRISQNGQVHEYPSMRDAGSASGIPAQYVSNVCRGERATTGGFVFMYRWKWEQEKDKFQWPGPDPNKRKSIKINGVDSWKLIKPPTTSTLIGAMMDGAVNQSFP